MHYRRFGKTNLPLSIFSLGTMRCLASEENAKATLERAISLGINHIETARGYGKSEEYLGRILKSGLSVRREQLYVTTKLPPTPDAKTMQAWIDESLQRLQLDYLDCLAIHGINTWEHLNWIQQPEGCMKAVREAITEGKVRFVGFSTHAPLDSILATLDTDEFDFVNLHYYYFFQRNAPALERAMEKDMGIFIISPVDKGGQLYAPPETLQKLCHPFSPVELNYRFLLSDSRITTLSIGAAHPAEFTEMIEVRDRAIPLTDTETATLQQLETHLRQTLNTDLCSQCHQCLPCPEAINIPEILRLRNLAVAYDMSEFGQYRYRMFENAGHWFPGKKGNRCTDCGDCLPRCPQQLNIPALLRDTHQRLNGSPRRRLWQ
ncbi:aldo/keto reductase [Lusitaniella coriacea LEGE 07157]|uniref:Aldo/keto reductase n=1 Tax=Lusitaniella coriacea LEGE 07157 TaxID=945747 RepID=A0A8J7JAX7_9CYAN|nr:aldo/keto reductase [Lusitaniella coriacea]MBE9116620.1 aldo/keto reductase [Lusitaniella coriacea LEGE 07157]